MNKGGLQFFYRGVRPRGVKSSAPNNREKANPFIQGKVTIIGGVFLLGAASGVTNQAQTNK